MRDWIKDYEKGPRRFQAGGPMGAPAGPEAGAPAGGGGAPDIEGMLAEYAQTRDPQLAVAICDALIEMLAAQGGGGGAAPAGPEAGAPMARRGARTRPIFRK